MEFINLKDTLRNVTKTINNPAVKKKKRKKNSLNLYLNYSACATVGFNQNEIAFYHVNKILIKAMIFFLIESSLVSLL